MADVAEVHKTEFQRYFENNPDASQQIMLIISKLYNNPMKIS